MIAALVNLLATFYQTGDLQQMETIARSMLAAIPNDLVALQFLGLALYRMGRRDEAYQAFRKVAARLERTPGTTYPTTCEQATSVSYREAIRASSGLAEGWQQIAGVMARLGFQKAAIRACKSAQTRKRATTKDRLQCSAPAQNKNSADRTDAPAES